MNRIGDRLKDVQRAFGLTQRQVAGRLNLHVNSLQNYMSGKRMPDGSVLETVCREFSVSPGWLLLGDGEMKSPNIDERMAMHQDEDLMKLAGEIGGLDARRRKLLWEELRMLEEIQGRDKGELLMNRLRAAGLSTAAMGWAADGMRRIEGFEREVLAAYWGAGPIDPDSLPSHRSGGGKRGGRRRTRVPESIRNRSADVSSDTGSDQGEPPQLPSRLEAALEKYELAWEGLLQKLDNQ